VIVITGHRNDGSSDVLVADMTWRRAADRHPDANAGAEATATATESEPANTDTDRRRRIIINVRPAQQRDGDRLNPGAVWSQKVCC
jgi:hypothetical protein